MTALSAPMTVLARDIDAGAFTRFSGHRMVARAEHIHQTRGRGRNRATRLVQVRLHRNDGSYDALDPDAPVRVRVPQ